MPIEVEARERALARYLELAVTFDFLKLYTLIIEHSPDLVSETDLFFRAIECGSRSMVEYFISDGRSLNEVLAGSGWTPLHFFAQSNYVSLIDFALDVIFHF